jgi:hypothetical protein
MAVAVAVAAGMAEKVVIAVATTVAEEVGDPLILQGG